MKAIFRLQMPGIFHPHDSTCSPAGAKWKFLKLMEFIVKMKYNESIVKSQDMRESASGSR